MHLPIGNPVHCMSYVHGLDFNRSAKIGSFVTENEFVLVTGHHDFHELVECHYGILCLFLRRIKQL